MAITTGLAPVNNNGTHLFFEDSGAPSQTGSYVTLILCHGAMIHGAFRRMFPHAAEHNLRLVAVTMRDYPRSTPFSPAEIEILRSSDSNAHASMIRDIGRELGVFLYWFIRNKNIPPLEYSDNGRTGGIVILGWSAGCCTTLSLLGNADQLPVDKRVLLGEYLRTSILMDPPAVILGIQQPVFEGFRNPVFDPSISAEDSARIFVGWVTGYFSHSPNVLSSLATTSQEKILRGLAHTPVHDLPSTTSTIPAEELSDFADFAAYTRSTMLILGIDRPVFHDNLRNALTSCHQVWPALRHVYIWCDRSVNDTLYAAWWFATAKRELWGNEDGRHKFIRMEGANHVPFWDEPKRTVKFIANLIQDQQVSKRKRDDSRL